MTLGRLESSKNTKLTTARVVKKWLISVMATTATTTSSSVNQATTPASQVKAVNSNATISTKGSRSVSVHEMRLTVISTLLFAEIDSSNKMFRKISKNAGNLTRALNNTLNTPKIRTQTTDTRLDPSNLLNSNKMWSLKNKLMPKSRKGSLASDQLRRLNLV